MSDWHVPPAALPEDIAGFLGARGAGQVNLYRALSNSPDMVRAWQQFIWALRDGCESPRALREIVILRTAVRHCSAYEWHHHVRMAERAGINRARIDAVAEWRVAGCFDELEQVALELTDAVCDCSISDEVAGRAMERLGPKVYVELCLTAGAYVMVPRILEVLGVPIEDGSVAEVVPWETPGK